MEEVFKFRQCDPQDVKWDEGVPRWAAQRGKMYTAERWQVECQDCRVRVDPEFQRRQDRHEMQSISQGVHTGEER
eukprot:10618635-Lingulodinium_polyedra.AAC.1